MAKREENFTAVLVKGIVQAGAIGLSVWVATTLLDYLVFTRADVQFIELAPSGEAFQYALVLNNYSSRTIENAEFSIASGPIVLLGNNQDTRVTVKPLTRGVNSFHIDRALPHRQLSAILQTSQRIDQSTFASISLPFGATFVATEMLPNPLFTVSNAVAIISQVIVLLVLLAITYRIATRIDREHEGIRLSLEEANEKVKATEADLRRTIRAMRLVLMRRITNLLEENQFWRGFLKSILATSMKEGVNGKKIVELFFARQGIKLEKALTEYEEDELEFLLREKIAERET